MSMEQARSSRPRDILSSMRWPVVLAFAVAWNGPLVFHLLRTGFDLANKKFYQILGIQVAILVIVCLVLAWSATVHRLVFRPGVAPLDFRRQLFVAALYYSGACIVLWGLAVMFD